MREHGPVLTTGTQAHAGLCGGGDGDQWERQHCPVAGLEGEWPPEEMAGLGCPSLWALSCAQAAYASHDGHSVPLPLLWSHLGLDRGTSREGFPYKERCTEKPLSPH